MAEESLVNLSGACHCSRIGNLFAKEGPQFFPRFTGQAGFIPEWGIQLSISATFTVMILAVSEAQVGGL